MHTFDASELSHASEWKAISDGGYSEVYQANLLGAVVAVKVATARKQTSGESLMREIRYLHQVGPHPNIVQVFGAFTEDSRLHLVLELARHCLRSPDSEAPSVRAPERAPRRRVHPLGCTDEANIKETARVTEPPCT